MLQMVVKNQEQFEFIRPLFGSASEYRLFRKHFALEPNAKIVRTDLSVDDAIPGSQRDGARYRIFHEVFADGATVEQINSHAREISTNAEIDADLFIALFRGFIKLG